MDVVSSFYDLLLAILGRWELENAPPPGLHSAVPLAQQRIQHFRLSSSRFSTEKVSQNEESDEERRTKKEGSQKIIIIYFACFSLLAN